LLRCSPAGFDVGSDRRYRDGWSDGSILYLINIKFFAGCGALGMWAKASISPLFELAREAGKRGRSVTPIVHISTALLVDLPRRAVAEALVLALLVIEVEPANRSASFTSS